MLAKVICIVKLEDEIHAFLLEDELIISMNETTCEFKKKTVGCLPPLVSCLQFFVSE